MIETYWVISMWVLSVASGYAMIKIYQKARRLEQVGIFTNRFFMMSYFGLIFASTVADTFALIIELDE